MADPERERRIDVLGVGVIAVDVLMQTPHLPREGHKTYASSAAMQGGGLVATALVAVSRLGGRARILGCLGRSRFAELALADLREEGVDVSDIMRKPGTEPVGIGDNIREFYFVIVGQFTNNGGRFVNFLFSKFGYLN